MLSRRAQKEKRRDHRRLPLRGDEDEGDDAEKNSGQRERVSRALVRCPLKKNEETTRRFFGNVDRLEETTTTTTINERESTNIEVEKEEEEFRLTFNDLALPEHIVLGLQKCGFVYPSPVQVSAIPFGTVRERLFDASKVRDRENGRVRVQTFRLSFANERRRSSGRKCDG